MKSVKGRIKRGIREKKGDEGGRKNGEVKRGKGKKGSVR